MKIILKQQKRLKRQSKCKSALELINNIRIKGKNYGPNPMAINLTFFTNFSGSYMRLPSMSMGCFMLFVKPSGVSFLNSSHSVTRIAASVSLRQLIAVVAYWILFEKAFLPRRRPPGRKRLRWHPRSEAGLLWG